MKEIARVKVDHNSMLYLEKLSYETDGLKVLFSALSPVGETYSRLLEDYKKRYCEMKVALNMIVEENCQDYLSNGKIYLFQPDFFEGVIVVNEQ